MGIDPEKYITFNRASLEAALAGIPHNLHPSEVHSVITGTIDGLALDDAITIRLQDVFAGTALHTYAGTILSVLALTEAHLTDDQADYLHELADYFASMGDKADANRSRRLPD